MDTQSHKFMIKQYQSGVRTIQSKQFNEDGYYTRISDNLADEAEGLSTVKLAEKMKINVVLMKEHLHSAEDKGFVCRDESYEGVQWFSNRILNN